MNQGLFAGLFDFSFDNFITTRVVKFLYGLILLLIGLGCVAAFFTALATMFTDSFFTGLVMLIVVPVVALIYTLMARIWMEIIIVLFRIAENTAQLVRQGGP